MIFYACVAFAAAVLPLAWLYRPLQWADLPLFILFVVVAQGLALLAVQGVRGRYSFDATVVVACGLLLPGFATGLLLLLTGDSSMFHPTRQRPLLHSVTGRFSRALYHSVPSMAAASLVPPGPTHLLLAGALYGVLQIGLNYLLIGLVFAFQRRQSWISVVRVGATPTALMIDALQVLGGISLVVMSMTNGGLVVGILVVCGLSYMSRSNMLSKSQVEKLQADVTRDPLTGLLNRRGIEDLQPRAFSRCQRAGQPLTVVMLDIDNFKRINDSFGHDRGDQVLQAVGKAIFDAVRLNDLASRWGGEEFCLVLSDANEEQSRFVAERIRQEVSKLDLLPDHRNITLSAGVCGQRDGGFREMVLAADQALYRAKNSGRNQVLVAA